MKTVGVIFEAALLVLVLNVSQALENPVFVEKDKPAEINSFKVQETLKNNKLLKTNSSANKDIDHRNKNGYNAIYYAVKENASITTEFLLDLGADLRQVYGNDSLTLLQVADKYGSNGTRDSLIHWNVNLNSTINGTGVDARSVDGYNALYWAVSEDAIETAAALVDIGANLTQLYTIDDYNLLHVAVVAGKLRAARWLLSKGLSVNSTAKAPTTDFDIELVSLTPLHLAARIGNLPMTEVLLEHGACIECKNELGDTPLHEAAFEGHLSVVKELLKVSSCINCTNIYKSTPLHYAAVKGHLPVVKLLVERGSCIECLNVYKHTPLIKAVQGGHESVIKELLRAGSCINCGISVTPLQFAALNGLLPMVKFLVENGADVNYSMNEYTPLSIALIFEHPEVAEYLKSVGGKEFVLRSQ